ncbi:MAG: efflux RND transporter periplasmic adaptor subunit [Proteobacteria bacterium]|nr:efflux RND transporter periplasmic adaptor subunit [Pseudomonadota bacterium]
MALPQLPRRLTVIGLIAVVAVGGWAMFMRGGGGDGPRRQMGPRPVNVAAVTRETFSDRIEALGTVMAQESVNVTAKVQGIIRSIYFDDGATIEKGREIAAIDAGEQTAQLNVELANLEQQRSELERTLVLARDNHISQARVDEQTAALKKAEANVAAARVRAGDRLITAPFSGVVGTRRISVGALVSPGTVVTTLDDISKVKLDFAVPETFLASLKPGLPIEGTTAAYNDATFKGTVIAVDSRVDPTTRSVSVRAEIDNKDLRLRPGMLMVVELIKDQRESLMIPEAALDPANDKQYVVIANLETNTAHRVEVKIGRRRLGFVEILSGLKEGDMVVREGLQDLNEGAKIEIMNRAETADQHASRLVEPS